MVLEAESFTLLSLTQSAVRTALEAHEQLHELLEVVMDLGRPPLARFPGGDVKLSEEPVTAEDLAQAVDKVGGICCLLDVLARSKMR